MKVLLRDRVIMAALSPYLELQDVGNLGMLCMEFASEEWAHKMSEPFRIGERLSGIHSGSTLYQLRELASDALTMKTNNDQQFTCFIGHCMRPFELITNMCNQDVVQHSTCQKCAQRNGMYCLESGARLFYIMELNKLIKNRLPNAETRKCMIEQKTREYFHAKRPRPFPLLFQIKTAMQYVYRFQDLRGVARKVFDDSLSLNEGSHF